MSIKEVHSQGGVVFSSAGVLQMRTCTLFGVKNSRFFEIYGVSARIRRREAEPMRTFFKQGGSIFRDFVRTSFYGRAPKRISA